MGHYRLYFLDEQGRINRALDLECADDEEAVSRVSEHRYQYGLELWEGARLVKRFPASEEP